MSHCACSSFPSRSASDSKQFSAVTISLNLVILDITNSLCGLCESTRAGLKAWSKLVRWEGGGYKMWLPDGSRKTLHHRHKISPQVGYTCLVLALFSNSFLA